MGRSTTQTRSQRHATTTLWQATDSMRTAYAPLKQDVEADVAIIGGGITGLTAAMHLKMAGKEVVILEAGRLGSGTTGGTSGHLEALPDQGVEQLINDFGEPPARLVTLARMAAIAQIETWCGEWGIDCDFRRVPAYVYSETADGAAVLQRECDAARRLGLETSMVTPPALRFARSGFRIENQARFHSLRYLQGLAERVQGEGVTIYEQSQAAPPTDGEPCVVKVGNATVSARDVIVATHSAFLGITELDTRVAPYQSYVLVARADGDLPDALYWDDMKPYHYTRLASSDDPRLLVIGGADHKTGQGRDEREAFGRLEQYARERFQVERIEYQWSAGLFEPVDGLPFVGRSVLSNHLYVSTGYSGTGLTFGTLAGRLLADLILGLPSPTAEILTPARIKPMAAGANFLSENLNVAKRFVADRFAGEPIESLDEIRSGEGRLVRYRGNQWAVYRDEQGMVHVLSPVCTHAGCHVQWNEFESTWDCPCHGGRYSSLGKRIYGPPPKDLASKPLDEL